MKKTTFAALVLIGGTAFAQESNTELAKKLSNPVSAMISFPLQFNYDQHFGADHQGSKYFVNVQPVVPFQLNTDWNLITRTILPVVHQDDVIPGSSQTGISDINESLFLSPAKPGAWIWGAGAALLFPTGSDDKLSARKWGAGPTVIVLKQQGHNTFGMLADHLSSFAGDAGRPDISSTFFQPFFSHVTPSAVTSTLSTESTYDWKAKQWSVPIILTATKLMKFGSHHVSLGGGLRYWAEGPDSGPHDWGIRLIATFVFPK